MRISARRRKKRTRVYVSFAALCLFPIRQVVCRSTLFITFAMMKLCVFHRQPFLLVISNCFSSAAPSSLEKYFRQITRTRCSHVRRFLSAGIMRRGVFRSLHPSRFARRAEHKTEAKTNLTRWKEARHTWHASNQFI